MTRFTSLIISCLLVMSLNAAVAQQVRLETNHGDIVIELFADKAPESTANFLRYLDAGHYQDTIFHRVIDGFVIQGGGYTTDFSEKPVAEPIINEATNALSNLRGTLAMARTMAPHSATAQFYINHGDNPALDHAGQHSPRAWGYAVFGRVIEGMDVVDRIAGTETGPGGPFPADVPVDPVIILQAERIEQQEPTETEEPDAS